MLFKKVEQWFAVTYNASQKVIQFKDSDSGVIVGRAITSADVGFGVANTLYYTIQVDVKDERVRVSGDNFNWTIGGRSIELQKSLDDVHLEMENLSNNLEKYLSKTSKVDNDW